jgi:hypothetical protein
MMARAIGTQEQAQPDCSICGNAVSWRWWWMALTWTIRQTGMGGATAWIDDGFDIDDSTMSVVVIAA